MTNLKYLLKCGVNVCAAYPDRYVNLLAKSGGGCES